MYYFFYCVLRLTDKTFAQFIGSAKQAREKLWAVTKEVLNMRRSIGSLAARLSDERRLLKGIAETHADGRGANRIPAFLSACFRKGMSATTVHAQLVKAIADEYTVKGFNEKEIDAVCLSMVLHGPASMYHMHKLFNLPSADVAAKRLASVWGLVGNVSNCRFEQATSAGDFASALIGNS